MGRCTQPHSWNAQVGKLVGPRAKEDATLQNERCVFQILRKHYKRYTPELVEQICGTPRATFLKVAETVLANAGPDRQACTTSKPKSIHSHNGPPMVVNATNARAPLNMSRGSGSAYHRLKREAMRAVCPKHAPTKRREFMLFSVPEILPMIAYDFKIRSNR